MRKPQTPGSPQQNPAEPPNPATSQQVPANGESVKRYRSNWQGEIDGAELYRRLAEAEPQQQLADVYRRLAAAELRHSRVWEERLRQAGAPVPAPRPGWRPRALGWLARRFGPQLVLPTINANEQRDSRSYDAQPEATAAELPAQERSHARLLQAIAGGKGQGVQGPMLAQIEGRHRARSGNALRAAVLGASDGLLSNFSLVMGVAGLLAGAFSMALGEWISVQSSREMYERQIAIEREELESAPEEEEEELSLIYQAKGMQPDEAAALAHRLMADKDTALGTLSREELSIDPEELGGSPMEAAVTSFLLFGAGALLPVLPFTFLSGLAATAASLGLGTLGLFAIGAAITLFTGRSVLASGLRQVVVGLAAAAVTYGVGRIIGINLIG
jgi:VIT1/CCC1 family predicted Fe2+/Mn2+ transporter